MFASLLLVATLQLVQTGDQVVVNVQRITIMWLQVQANLVLAMLVLLLAVSHVAAVIGRAKVDSVYHRMYLTLQNLMHCVVIRPHLVTLFAASHRQLVLIGRLQMVGVLDSTVS
jgi:hypothetical protein